MEKTNTPAQAETKKQSARKQHVDSAAVKVNGSIYDALLDIQAHMQVKKDRIGLGANGDRYPYFSLDAILSALTPFLEKHSIVVLFRDELEGVGNRLFMKSTIVLQKTDGKGEVCATGYAEFGNERGRAVATITGGCATYARKYAASALFKLDDTSLSPTVDPDAENAIKDAVKAAAPIEENTSGPDTEPQDPIDEPQAKERLTKEDPRWGGIVCDAARSYRSSKALRGDLEKYFVIDDETFASLASEAGLNPDF